jgi:hypothetical protein
MPQYIPKLSYCDRKGEKLPQGEPTPGLYVNHEAYFPVLPQCQRLLSKCLLSRYRVRMCLLDLTGLGLD